MSEQNMNSVQASGMPPVVSPQVIAEAELIGRPAVSAADLMATGASKLDPKMGIGDVFATAESAPQGEVARIMAVAVDHMDRMKNVPEIKELMAEGSNCCAFPEGSKTPVGRGRRTKMVASLVACAAIASGMIGLSAYRLYHTETATLVQPSSTPAAPAMASVATPTPQMSVSNSSNYSSMAVNQEPAEVAKPAAAVVKSAPVAVAHSLTSTFAATSGKTVTAATSVPHVPAPVVATSAVAATPTAKPIVSSAPAASTVAKATPSPVVSQARTFVAPEGNGLDVGVDSTD